MISNPNENKPNLVISGVGSSSGGNFHLVRVDGIAKITGDVDCNELIVNGKFSTKGSVRGDSIEINGDATSYGAVRANQVKVNGKFAVQGLLSADKIRVSGYLKVKENCEAESLTVHGGFSIDGLLNAGNVDILLYDHCKVKEIGGETIRVRKHGADLLKLLKSIFGSRSPRLEADLIEGDDIQLEHTEAAVVRGNNVVLGAGCVIQKVEYKDSILLDKGAKVTESVKL